MIGDKFTYKTAAANSKIYFEFSKDNFYKQVKAFTLQPHLINLSTKCDPINPSAPVTKTFINYYQE
jgi:hypothetical protein